MLTSLFKGFMGSEEIVYKHKQEVGIYRFCTAWIILCLRLATPRRLCLGQRRLVRAGHVQSSPSRPCHTQSCSTLP